MKYSLSIKYYLFSILLISVITVVYTFVFVKKHSTLLENNLKREGDVYIAILESSIAEEIVAKRIDVVNKNISHLMTSPIIEYVFVLDNKGKIISSSGVIDSENSVLIDEQLKDYVEIVNENTILQNDELLEIVTPINFGNEKIGAIFIGFSKSKLHSEMLRFNNIALVLGLAFIILGSLFTRFIIRKISQPLLQFTELTKNISKGRFGETIEVKTQDEISTLAYSFNKMSSQIEEANASLVQAKEDAERFNDIKTEFLAQMSHEIRTPINTMLNYASLAEEDPELNKIPECVSYFEVMKNAGKRIIRTIDLILNMSEIEKGSYQPSFSKFDIFPIINQLYLELKNKSDNKDLKFSVENNAKVTMIFADKYTITQIFQNIIDNAIKYTEEGFVKVVVSNVSGYVVIEVKDSGLGISEEFQKTMFEAFRQEEQGYTRKYDGAGLGLALVAKYCELNKAEIEVKSEKGKGTSFIVSLKL